MPRRKRVTGNKHTPRVSHVVCYRDCDKRRIVISMHGSEDVRPGTRRGTIHDLGLSVEELVNKLRGGEVNGGGSRGKLFTPILR